MKVLLKAKTININPEVLMCDYINICSLQIRSVIHPVSYTCPDFRNISLFPMTSSHPRCTAALPALVREPQGTQGRGCSWKGSRQGWGRGALKGPWHSGVCPSRCVTALSNRGVMSIHRSALTDGKQATIIPCKLSKEQNVVLLLEECRFY